MGAADLLDRLVDLVVLREGAAGGAGRLGEGEQQVLGGDVLVAQLPGLALGGAQDVEQLAGGAGLLGAGRDLGQRVERLVDEPADLLGAGAELAQDAGDHALGLLEQHGQQVGRRDLGVLAGGRQRESGLDGLLGLGGEAIHLHASGFLDLSRGD